MANVTAVPLRDNDAARWRRVVFDAPDTSVIQDMTDSRQYFRLKLDADSRTLTLTKPDGGLLLIDPGAFTPAAAELLARADAVLITHEHEDHVHPTAVAEALEAREDLRVYGPAAVVGKWADRGGVALPYASRPSWPLYCGVLSFAERVRRDLRDLRPRDMIDIQSFLWVQGSEEYPD